ncbi:MAG TPA: MMPL family transporter [Mycobacteriales bacterium]|nr:MMPL family transporter [Mycobacteriales bacterium]
MERFARWVLRHRRSVVAFWVLVFLFGAGYAAGHTSKRLKVDFALPGQPGYETQKQIADIYGTEQTASLIPVIHATSGTIADHQADVDRIFSAIPSYLDGARVVDYANTHDPALLTDHGTTTYAYVFYPLPKTFADNPMNKIRDGLKKVQVPGLQVSATGRDLLEQGNQKNDNKSTSVLGETLLGGLGALIVLVFVFASFLALLPMLIAAVSILGCFAILLPLTYITSVSFVVQFLVALIGLGVAIDYSLLLVTRWREERDHGRDREESVVVAVETAGHAVLFSGVTVAIGLLALVVLPVPGIRSMGFGGMLVPLVSTLATLTLLPVILATIGPWVDRPRIRHEDTASRAWSRWTKGIVKYRWGAAGLALAILALLIAPVFGLHYGSPSVRSLANKGPAFTTYQQLQRDGLPTGALTPMTVLVDTAHGGSTATVAKAAATVEGVDHVAVPDDAQWQKDGTAVVLVFPHDETVTNASSGVVKRVQSAVKPLTGVVGVAGLGAIQTDYAKAVYDHFPLVLLVLVIITFVLLTRAFRSVLLSIKAVILNLISLAATFGLMTFFWQHGHGSKALFDVSPTGAITFWVPVLVFAFLYGLSMDYEVFILARTREEYDATGDTDEAIIEGLGRTGRLVTSAALILFLAFASLASGPQVDIKVLATGLGAGILLDATVIRALLVPALVSLFGSWNWYLPDRLAKVLRVQPSHAQAVRGRREGRVVEPAGPAGTR